MDDSSVIRYCLLGAIITLAILYFLSFTLEEKEISPSDLSHDLLGRRVKISGNITEVDYHPNGHIFFEVSDNKTHADVVIWDNRAEQFRISGTDLSRIMEGSVVEVRGTVELYKGGLQVVV